MLQNSTAFFGRLMNEKKKEKKEIGDSSVLATGSVTFQLTERRENETHEMQNKKERRTDRRRRQRRRCLCLTSASPDSSLAILCVSTDQRRGLMTGDDVECLARIVQLILESAQKGNHRHLRRQMASTKYSPRLLERECTATAITTNCLRDQRCGNNS